MRARPPRIYAFGLFLSREEARRSLFTAMARDGGWWGVPMLERWGARWGLTTGQVFTLVDELTDDGSIVANGGLSKQFRVNE